MNIGNPTVNQVINVIFDEIYELLNIKYSPPEKLRSKNKKELITSSTRPNVFKKSINLSLEIEVFTVSLKTDLSDLKLGINNFVISFT
tara:strand:+ start:2860 stop:3123 length:264 start_codon:yes stop_codon:yes gene_type:complete